MLKDRQKSILGAAVDAYIRTARPVASRDLAQKFHFGLSPATLRNELYELDDLGYLEQPHTSAGRVPTDRGYRFFVDHLLSGPGLTGEEQHAIRKAFEVSGEDSFVKELSRAVAHISGAFTAAGLAEDDAFYGTGLSELLEEPEFEDQTEIRNFGRMADMMDEEVRRLFAALEDGEETEKIFIGRENPWKQARAYTMAIGYWEHPDGFSGFISMIGPRRANYRKQKAILETIAEFYE